MTRYALIVSAALGLVLSSGAARAGVGSLCYSGYQPWWNVFAHRPKCMTPEEERLQHFWHDYYHALKDYYCALDHLDCARVKLLWAPVMCEIVKSAASPA